MNVTKIAKAGLLMGLVALAAAILAVRASGDSLLAITGGSMEPTIHKGALVVVQPEAPEDVRIGDVVTFVVREEATTHRVIATETTPEGRAFETKGDANVVADPELKLFTDRVGRVLFSVPFLGYAAVYAQAYSRLALLLVAAATLLASILGTIGRAVAERTSPQARRVRLYGTVRAVRTPRARTA